MPLTSRPASAARCNNRSLCLFTKTGFARVLDILSSTSLRALSLASSRFLTYSSVRRPRASGAPWRLVINLFEPLLTCGEFVTVSASFSRFASASFLMRSVNARCSLAALSPIVPSRPGIEAARTRDVSFISTLGLMLSSRYTCVTCPIFLSWRGAERRYGLESANSRLT